MTVCLVMIVKNEAAVIRRCLSSVKSLISHWIVCDTGSSDDTREIVSGELRDVPGTLHRVPWVNFGFNRTQALELARGKADYLLMMDADEVLKVNGPFPRDLQADAYLLRFEGSNDYHLPLLLSSRHEWRYEGVTHEAIAFDPSKPWVKLPGVSILHYEDGGARADKYTRDIRLLRSGLESAPKNARYVYYLAQSYRDIGAYDEAVKWYTRRTQMGGWDEEAWSARYQIARLLHLLGREWPLVQNHYLAAFQARPQRLEPLLHLARYYRELNQFELGYLFSRPIANASYPEDILFVERDVYEWQLPVEHALCCDATGRHDQAVKMLERIKANVRAPGNIREWAATCLKPDLVSK